MASHSPRSSGDGHWLLEAKDAKHKRVNPRAIVEHAHALVHEGGSSALSMRALASSLSTSTSALYRRFPSKEWLLIAIVDLVLDDVETARPGSTHARAGLEHLSHSLRGVVAAHPHLHEVFASRVTLTPNTIRIADAALGYLLELGVEEGELVDAYNAWSGYVLGFTAIETKPPNSSPEPELQAAMRRQLEAAGEDSAPVVARLRTTVTNSALGLRWTPGSPSVTQRGFERGLQALLDGFSPA